MFHTVYDSFESRQGGRDYIGKHSTEDPYDGYLGSYEDKTFNPDDKIVFAYAKTAEGAVWLEIMFQRVFGVVEDPQFANQSYQTSTGFDRTGAVDSEETRRKKTEAQRGNKKGLGNKSKTGQTNSPSHTEAIRRASMGNTWGSATKGKPKPQRFKEFMAGNQYSTGMLWWVNELGETEFQKESPGLGWQKGRKWRG
jgi:hypothetical protein